MHVVKTAHIGSTDSTTGTISAGDTAAFTLTVRNDGQGTANGVTLNDKLPTLGASGLWSIDTTYGDASLFTITGSAGSQTLTLASPLTMGAYTTKTVRVSCVSDPNLCGEFRNEAFVTATNELPGDQTDDRGASIILVNPKLTADDLAYLGNGGPLMAAGPVAQPATTSALTAADLQSIVAEARALWGGAGISTQDLARLDGVPIQVLDLPDSMLGLAIRGEIWIDSTAAGHGWFVDAVPGHSPTAGQEDLLSVVSHEMGHLLGFEHDHGDEVMAAALPVGVRRIPGSTPAGDGAALAASSSLPSNRIGTTAPAPYSTITLAEFQSLFADGLGTQNGSRLAQVLGGEPNDRTYWLHTLDGFATRQAETRTAANTGLVADAEHRSPLPFFPNVVDGLPSVRIAEDWNFDDDFNPIDSGDSTSQQDAYLELLAALEGDGGD
jgi:uncharacterized repeat protein (TIGR01451 family)